MERIKRKWRTTGDLKKIGTDHENEQLDSQRIKDGEKERTEKIETKEERRKEPSDYVCKVKVQVSPTAAYRGRPSRRFSSSPSSSSSSSSLSCSTSSSASLSSSSSSRHRRKRSRRKRENQKHRNSHHQKDRYRTRSSQGRHYSSGRRKYRDDAQNRKARSKQRESRHEDDSNDNVEDGSEEGMETGSDSTKRRHRKRREKGDKAVDESKREQGAASSEVDEERDTIVAAVCSNLVDELVDDYMRGELIPDILIDVLTTQSDEYNSASVEDQISYEILEQIMHKVVGHETGECVRIAIRDFMNSFLQVHVSRRENDPVYTAVVFIIDDVVKSLIHQVVREALKEMVNEFLFLQQFEAFLDNLILPQITSTAKQAHYETEMEEAAQSILEDTVASLGSQVARESLDESKGLIVARAKLAEYDRVALLMNRLLDRAVMHQLVQTVATQAENVIFREQMDALVHGKVAEWLFQKIMLVASPERAMRRNVALWFAFQETTARVLGDCVFDEFVQSLDLYEADLDAQERETMNGGFGEE